MTDQRTKHLRVQCMNGECPAPADTVIPIPIIAPGVVQWPQGLRCKECGRWIFLTPCGPLQVIAPTSADELDERS